MRDAFADLVLGSRCVRCERPGRVLCPACEGVLPSGSLPVVAAAVPQLPARVAGWYDDPLRPLLLAHKERRVLGLAPVLGRLLAGAIAPLIAEPRDRLGEGEPGAAADVGVLLVPIPSRPEVVRARGHDPVRRMTLAAVRELRASGVPALLRPVLGQHRRVADQAGLGAAERAANLHGALRVRPGVRRRLVGRRWSVVLCDDILTTGATFAEAARALAAAGLRPGAAVAVAATRLRRSG